jgi:hypothetical protein
MPIGGAADGLEWAFVSGTINEPELVSPLNFKWRYQEHQLASVDADLLMN